MTAIHELTAGADVFSRDGHKLGELHRLVLKRSDLAVSHVVIDIGFLRSGRPLWQGGLGLDYDRVVPVDAIAQATPERVGLTLTAEEFKAAPEYTAESFEPPHDLTPGEFDIPDVVNRLQGLAGMLNNTANTWLHEKLNKPIDSVDIREGTPVWRRQPHQKLGEVMRVLLDDKGRVTALVIQRGILKRDAILPVRYIAELHDDLIRVDIGHLALSRLQEYEA